ncbi:MAG: ArnT family glycosyltransferase [Gemmataceae bacterium]
MQLLPGLRRIPVSTMANEPSFDRAFRALAWLLIVVGFVVRLERYALDFPIWGDESFVALNFLDRDFLGLTRALESNQIAPVLFLWIELAATKLLGHSTWALRLLPMLAGLTSLLMFRSLARRLVSEGAATLAVGVLAVSFWPVTQSTTIKPYAGDLLCSLALLIPAVRYLQSADLRWLWLLIALIPVVLLMSYPAVFIVAAVGLALAPTVWRRGSGDKFTFALLNLFAVAVFLGHYLWVGRAQIGTTGGDVQQYYQGYWSYGFPPHNLWGWPVWLLQVHVGRMFAYPGGDKWLCWLPFGLFLLGTWRFRNERGWSLSVLLLGPFALNLVAAALGKYPYGACGRLSQHLAPAICLLIGVGADWCLQFRATSASAYLQGVRLTVLGLAGIGLALLLGQAYEPFHDREARWTDRVAMELVRQSRSDEPIIVLNPREHVWQTLRWRLASARRVEWVAADGPRCANTKGRIWVFHINGEANAPPEMQLLLTGGNFPRKVVAQAHFVLPPSKGTTGPTRRVSVYCCDRSGAAPRPIPVFSSMPAD